MQVANDLSVDQLRSTRLTSDGVIKHVADVRLLIPHDVPDSDMYDLLIKQAREYLKTPELDRGVVRINNSNFTTVFDPNGNVEIQHAHGHYNIKSPILIVLHEYVKKTPGSLWGFSEEHVIETILRLSVARTPLITAIHRPKVTRPVAPEPAFSPEDCRMEEVKIVEEPAHKEVKDHASLIKPRTRR